MRASNLVKWVLVMAAASVLAQLAVAFWKISLVLLAAWGGAYLGLRLAEKASERARHWRNRRRIRQLLLTKEITWGALPAELEQVGFSATEVAMAFEKLGKVAFTDRRQSKVILFDRARRIAERSRRRRETL